MKNIKHTFHKVKKEEKRIEADVKHVVHESKDKTADICQQIKETTNDLYDEGKKVIDEAQNYMKK